MGKEMAEQDIKKWHYFTAGVYFSENFSELTLSVGGASIDLPSHLCPANRTMESLMRYVAERIREVDSRTEIIEEDGTFNIEFKKEAYLQVLKEYYMVMSTEEILSLCREKIFVTHFTHYIRPKMIEVNKDEILVGWGYDYTQQVEHVHKFSMFNKPKGIEWIYIICHIINEYSGNKYQYSLLMNDQTYQYGQAAVLKINDPGDVFAPH